MSTERQLAPNHWIHNYADLLFAYTIKRIGDAALAEDIVQDVFLSAWKNKDSYNGLASEKNWLFTICKNKIIDYYRKKNSQQSNRPIALDNADLFQEDGHWLDQLRPQQWPAHATNSFEQKEFMQAFAHCLHKLKQIQQNVFSLKHVEDLSADEICEQLQITQQNYWVIMHRAKILLRACLEKNWIKL